jgi:hypothetical protein
MSDQPSSPKETLSQVAELLAPYRVNVTYSETDGEPMAEDVVIELTPASTRQKDLGDKRLLYEELGVGEYFIFDPLHEYLEPPLRGFRLEEGFYTPLKANRLDSDQWELHIQVLELTLRSLGNQLRLYDPQTGQMLHTLSEEANARRQAEQRLAELEAELAHLRK